MNTFYIKPQFEDMIVALAKFSSRACVYFEQSASDIFTKLYLFSPQKF